MKYGLSETEFAFLKMHLIDPLKKKGARVYLFGSRATGNFKRFSDVDILLSFPPSTTNTQDQHSKSEIFKILSFMEDSSFPYKIDLVSQQSLADSYREGVMQSLIEL